ncbi:hypothetical protein HMPREF9103_01345 [Lentilactobacillus parafarraginis F0439]|uniref:Uncharacterized protein n=1 Tax=Lentilactobacillus parafarraginis F0439 TaxID=797515 RepID=G9ZNP1_9LACO|nr:hypothetical protein HMPREF9103_01345 [Lentilactobacillus parafarraginis F0439]
MNEVDTTAIVTLATFNKFTSQLMKAKNQQAQTALLTNETYSHKLVRILVMNLDKHQSILTF